MSERTEVLIAMLLALGIAFVLFAAGYVTGNGKQVVVTCPIGTVRVLYTQDGYVNCVMEER